ncbi:hypothetical protein LCGC14_2362000, partial [marine sediment metagenome]
AQADMNQWAARANEVAARLQEHGVMLSVTITRTKTPNGGFNTNIKLVTGDMSINTHIELFEMYCDKLDEEEEG